MIALLYLFSLSCLLQVQNALTFQYPVPFSCIHHEISSSSRRVPRLSEHNNIIKSNCTPYENGDAHEEYHSNIVQRISNRKSRREILTLSSALLGLVGISVQSCKAEESVNAFSIIFNEGPIGLELQDNLTKTDSTCATSIKRIIAGSQAAEQQQLRSGLGILSINGQSTIDMKAKEVTKMIMAAKRPVTLTFQDTAAVLSVQQSRPTTEEELYVRTVTAPKDCGIRSRRGDLIEINYTGRYRQDDDWVEFDSSAKRGTGLPYSFVLGYGEVIKGLDLSLDDMCIGEVRSIRIPSGLAYGQKGSRAFKIPPDMSLSFLVELVSVNFVTDSTATRGDNFYSGDPCSKDSLKSGTASGRCQEFQ